NKISDKINAGTVVHPILRICSNKSTPTMEEARFVVSERGDILSPKKAPDTIAPAAIGKDKSSICAIPINATPTVAVVVKELPIEIPITAQTTNTMAKKYVGEINWHPA